ncbi:hypothetical protein OHA74_13240 [Streptomyces phaeochromogenes]|uniref:hypothetical protein n=1 Tax=Streptomyces phaeochromogenes TaxID=1923 RepID=UPI002E2DF231|nr:hypothetical protein [Streptomyces phaeochromogenes]
MQQPDPTSRAPLPVLRAAVFAIVGTVLGVSAHHLVAEGPAPWRQSALTVLALFGVGLVGARRPRSLTTVVVACGAAQAGLHSWLMTAHANAGAAAPMAAMPGRMHHVADAHQAWHELLHDSVAMTAVHALAAVLVAVLLHRADTVCWSPAHGLTTAVDAARARIATVRALLGGRPPLAEAGPPALALAWLEQPPPAEAVLADVVVRRGPPQAGLTLAN